MAEDPRFLLHFKTLAKFKEKLADGTINEERHLVFIKDEKLIWCRGVYYSDASKLDNFSSYYNDWSITLSNASTMTITLKGNKWNETTRKWEAISKALTVKAATSTVSGLMSAQDKRQVDIIDTANFKLEDPTTSATQVVINASHTDVNAETRNLKTSKTLTSATSTNAGILTAEDKRLLDIITSANFELTAPTTTANTVVLHTKRTNVNDETDNIADSELTAARTIPAATSTKAGVMSATDKTELDRINTANFKLGNVTADTSKVTISSTKTNISNGAASTDVTIIPSATIGTAGVMPAAYAVTITDLRKLKEVSNIDVIPFSAVADSVTLNYSEIKIDGAASTAGTIAVYKAPIPVSSDTQAGIITAAEHKLLNTTIPTDITNLQNSIKALDYTDTAVANLFVTSVSETDGVISVTRARPTATNVSNTAIAASNTQVALAGTNLLTTIGNIATAIKSEETARINAINALDSTKTSTDGAHVTVKVTQTDGKISAVNVTETNIANASDLSKYLLLSGGSMTGTLNLLSSLWWNAGSCGLNAKNSDIIGLNGLYFNGLNEAWGEGLLFNRDAIEDKQGSFPFDRLNAYNGELYFDVVTNASSPINQNKVLHQNNYAGILDTRYVTLGTSLTITGAKTFSNSITIGNTIYGPNSITNLMFFNIGMDDGSCSIMIDPNEITATLGGSNIRLLNSSGESKFLHLKADDLSVYGNSTFLDVIADNILATQFIKLGGTNQQFLMADGSITTKKEATALTHTGHTNAAAGNLMIPTISFITYWNGAYDSSNHSNLRYCFRGLFGDIVTHAHSEYVTALGTSGNYLTWTKNGTANNITVPYATTTSVVSSNGLIAPLTGTNKHGSGIRMYEGYNNGYPSTYGNVLAIQGNTHGGAGELYMSWNGSGNTTPGHLYYRLISDITGSTWSPWVTILDSDNYSTTLDTRYYTKTQIDTNTVKSITMSASVSNTTGTPSVSVTKGGTTANPTYSFAFSGIKGEKGDKGDTGPRGATGATGPLGPAGSDASISESDRRLLSGHFPLYFSDTEAPDGIDIIAYARNCSINPKLGVIYLQPGTVDLEKHWAEYRGSGIYLANNGNNSPTETLTIERSKIIADPNFTIQSDSIDIIASEDILTQSRSTISILTPKFILTTGSLDWEFTNNVYSNNLTYKYNDGFTWESDHAEYFQVKSSTTGVGLACTQNSTFISAYYAEPDKSGMQYRRKIPDEHGYDVSYVFCGENLEIWCINEITANKTITVSSDRNLKQNILDISDNILDSLSNIKYKQFEYKESKDNRPQYGVIALEVLEADIPGIVSKSEKSEYYYVNYNSLYALEIANLKKQVKELQDVVNQLKSIILDNI